MVLSVPFQGNLSLIFRLHEGWAQLNEIIRIAHLGYAWFSCTMYGTVWGLWLCPTELGSDSSPAILHVWPWHITEPLLRLSFLICRMGEQWCSSLIGWGKITHIKHLAWWHILNTSYATVRVLKLLHLSLTHSEHLEINSLIMFEFSSLNVSNLY